MARKSSIPVKTEFQWDLLGKCFARVWWKLPAEDRQVIEARLFLVTDSEKWRDPALDFNHANGCTRDVPGGFVVYLNSVNLVRCTEKLIEAVIGHELAHVYCNHKGMPVINAAVVEPQADKQAWAWGFETHRQAEGYKSEVRRIWVKARW